MKEIQEFFNQPGINKSGVCSEAGINIRFLNMMLNGDQRMTDATKRKFLPVIKEQVRVAERALSFLSTGGISGVSPSLPSDDKLQDFIEKAHDDLCSFEAGAMEDPDYEMDNQYIKWVDRLKELLGNRG